MNIKQRAAADIARFTGDASGWGQPITFIAPDGSTCTVTGIHSKIHLAVDTDGNIVNSKKATITFSEKYLTAQNYPVRNAKNEVEMDNHKISTVDANGTVKNYIVYNFLPDETIGTITCIMNVYDNQHT